MKISFLKMIYLSPLGIPIHFLQAFLGRIFRPFMVYGYYDKSEKKFRKYTRVSSTALLSDDNKISIGDNCWIWHHSILDGSNGIKIGKGVQIGAWVGIFTHSSHIAIRLHGENYLRVDRDDRVGYVRGSVTVGDYTFIGAGAKILPGVEVGSGCVISAGAMVTKDVPDYSIAAGNPAKVIGSTADLDKRFLEIDGIRDQYFNQDFFE
ncbi:acyltransferase [Alphaproteobacteria bacterium]|nr:acyltransferase [Alphaproteobacteria bacterium]